jgi:hypothetical protein
MRDVLKDDRESRLLFPCIGYKKLPLRVKPFASAAPNARYQARQTAGARDERTLFAVACMPLFGLVLADETRKIASCESDPLCLLH